MRTSSLPRLLSLAWLASTALTLTALAQGPAPDFTHTPCYLGPEPKDRFGCCHAPTWSSNSHLELKLKQPVVSSPRLCFNKRDGIKFEYVIKKGKPGKGLKTPKDGSAVVGLGLAGGVIGSIQVYSDPAWCLSTTRSNTVHLALDNVQSYPGIGVPYWFGMISIAEQGNPNVVVYAQTGSVYDVAGNIWIADDCHQWAADLKSGKLNLPTG